MPEAAPSTTKEPTLGVHNAQAEKPWATGHADRQTGYRGQRCASWAARSHLASQGHLREDSLDFLPSIHPCDTVDGPKTTKPHPVLFFLSSPLSPLPSPTAPLSCPCLKWWLRLGTPAASEHSLPQAHKHHETGP